jgi:cytochrome P450
MPLVSDLDLPELPIEGAEFSADPMRFLEPARARHPWLARFSKGYVVHGLEATRTLLYRDDRMGPHFSGLVEYYDAEDTDWGRFMRDQVATNSGPRHDRLRASVAAAFTPRHANRTRPLMRQVIGELLDEWAPKGAFDFADFASYFPITVMCGLLGVPSGPVREIRDALDLQMACMTMDRDLFPSILEAYQLLRSFAADLIAEREASGPQDADLLLDALIEAKRSGRLDADELRDLLITLLLAGFDTSKNELTLTMHALLEHPQMLERCAVDFDYCRKVIQESLRRTSVVSPSRTLFEDVDYEGIRFPKGTYICFALSLTGRDPAAFADPMAFRPEREQQPKHIAFGRGTHLCLGQYLATAQMEEGLHLIAQRITRPRLAGEVTWRPFRGGAWGIRTLPIEFEAAPARLGIRSTPNGGTAD